MPALPDRVRAHCAAVAAGARQVTIDLSAAHNEAGVEGLDAGRHFLEGDAEEVARYVLVLDALNFGSGWFAELGVDTDGLTERLTAHARARGGTWSAAELRAIAPAGVAAVLGLPGDHVLTGLYAEGLRQLGGWLGARSALQAITGAGGSAARLAEQLAAQPFLADHGFYERAQITAADLEPLPAGSQEEVELRACAVHACEALAARAGVPPRRLDNWLWNRGLGLPGRPHRTETVFY